MDELLEALATSLAHSGPEYTLALGSIAIGAWVSSKALPIWQTVKVEQLELEKERESRKASDMRRLDERDQERSKTEGRWLEQNERSMKLQEETNAAINAMKAALEMNNTLLGESKDRSRHMAMQVDEIHSIVAARKEGTA